MIITIYAEYGNIYDYEIEPNQLPEWIVWAYELIEKRETNYDPNK